MRLCICDANDRIRRTHDFHDPFEFVVAGSMEQVSDPKVNSNPRTNQSSSGDTVLGRQPMLDTTCGQRSASSYRI
jgi:hypothetical protein